MELSSGRSISLARACRPRAVSSLRAAGAVSYVHHAWTRLSAGVGFLDVRNSIRYKTYVKLLMSHQWRVSNLRNNNLFLNSKSRPLLLSAMCSILTLLSVIIIYIYLNTRMSGQFLLLRFFWFQHHPFTLTKNASRIIVSLDETTNVVI